MISMLFEKPFKQARVADHAIATKNLNLGPAVGEKLYLPALARHGDLDHDRALPN